MFSLPRVVPWFPLLGLTPSGLFMGSISTLIYTSELIICFTITVNLSRLCLMGMFSLREKPQHKKHFKSLKRRFCSQFMKASWRSVKQVKITAWDTVGWNKRWKYPQNIVRLNTTQDSETSPSLWLSTLLLNVSSVSHRPGEGRQRILDLSTSIISLIRIYKLHILSRILISSHGLPYLPKTNMKPERGLWKRHWF